MCSDSTCGAGLWGLCPDLCRPFIQLPVSSCQMAVTATRAALSCHRKPEVPREQILSSLRQPSTSNRQGL